MIDTQSPPPSPRTVERRRWPGAGAYNTRRPHQAIGMCTPAERFSTASPLGTAPELEPDLRRLAADRSGDDWVSRTASVNGTISVAWQIFSVGKSHGGQIVDVHVTDALLEVWAGAELIKTVLRTSKGVIRKKKAEVRTR